MSRKTFKKKKLLSTTTQLQAGTVRHRTMQLNWSTARSYQSVMMTPTVLIAEHGLMSLADSQAYVLFSSSSFKDI